MNPILKENINRLFKSWSIENAITIVPLPQSGSNRKYFRITGKTASAIAALNKDKAENRAFITFAKHFFTKNLPVPQVLAEDLNENLYLIEDLGNQTLFDLLNQEGFTKTVKEYYQQALRTLLNFQIEAGKDLDYSVCYPRDKFDEQSILWDLNYFKYYFLKLADIQFDEQKLENDFKVLAKYLSGVNADYFMYRDFQSRNIMIKDNQLYFIDFQGGRKGALQYDVASLLWSARANLTFDQREELLNYYLNELQKDIQVNTDEFIKYYYGFVLVRILQTLGAYGFRGFYERKDHFLKSIPHAIDNLEWLIENQKVTINCDELFFAIAGIINSEIRKKFREEKNDRLKIIITSFSYKQGIPQDTSGNGGGFVFDCRGLNNPGRYDEYKLLTGKDDAVIKFLEEKSDVDKYLKNVWKLILPTVKEYQERGFKNLMINFGCTGGQHRSVYCAEKTAKYFFTKPNLQVDVKHTELKKRDEL
ncbi:MAG: phosphotransferase enzyme family protein [Ignavibacteriales bacterium]|nr:MAG: phosphotransferase enzyme family protein [Ignavibacteriales bacterium]